MRNTAPRRVNPAKGRSSYSYVRGSAAPAYPQEYYDYRPRKLKRRKVRPAPVVTESFTRCEEKVNTSIGYVVMIVAIIVALTLGFLSVNSKISAVENDIRQTESLTKKTRAVNEQLENMLSEAVDMDKVKKIATTKLGMQTAAPHQNINVEKDGYSIQYDDQVANSKKKSLTERLGLK